MQKKLGMISIKGLSVFKENFGIFLLSSLFLSFSVIVHAQTGPGGVGNSSNIGVWLDVHTMGGTNGAGVGQWTDYSGNNVHAVQSNFAKQPIYLTNQINGRSALDFNTLKNMRCPANPNMNNILYFDWYVVGEVDNFNMLSIPFMADYGATPALDVFAGFLTQSGLPASSFSHNSSGHLRKANFTNSSGPNLYQGQYNRSNNTVNARLNFNLNNTNNQNTFNTAIHEGFDIGGKETSYRMDGRMSEIFVLNFQLNTAEQKILENYISAKYGISISNVMYDYASAHGLGVVGIGRDNGSNEHLASQGNGVVLINNPSDLNDGEYVFIGHDDVSINSLSTDFPAIIVDGTRLERTWRISKTGDAGTLDIKFDLDPSTDFSSANPSSYRLLVDGDGVFSTSDQIIEGVYNSIENSIQFTGVTFNDGDFFTLAGKAPLIFIQSPPAIGQILQHGIVIVFLDQ